MGSVYSYLVNSEIESLIDLGWSDIIENDRGIFISRRIQPSEISFPHESYDPNRGNEESIGIWARWRARQILKAMKQNSQNLIWEVGSGHGNVAIPLYLKNVAVIGIEPLLNGAIITSKLGIRTYLGTLESMNFPSNSVSAIGIFDVLEHLEKPEVLMAEIYRVLKPGGILLISVPAHQWLFSDYDSAIGHFRRYSRKSLLLLIEQGGFKEINMKFLYSVLVPAAALLRKIPNVFGRSRDSKAVNSSARKEIKVLRVLEPIFIVLLHIEELLHLPFGLSLFSVSKK